MSNLIKKRTTFISQHLEISVRGLLTINYEGRVDKSSLILPSFPFLTGPLPSVVKSENGDPHCPEISENYRLKTPWGKAIHKSLDKWYISITDPIARHTVDSISQSVGYVHSNCSKTWNKLCINDR